MRRLTGFSFVLVSAFSACSRSASVETAPAPAPAAITYVVPPPAAPAPDVPANTSKAALPVNWHLLDQQLDKYEGVSSERAMKELLAGKQPKRTVIVAVIDGGTDTAHVDLRGNLWTNPRETKNQRDDDGNGYVDDIRGWNFIGGKDGRNVGHDTFEATRLYAGCRKKAPSGDYSKLPAAEQDVCTRAAAEFNKQTQEMQGALSNVKQVDAMLTAIYGQLKTALKIETLTDSAVAAFQPTTTEAARAKTVYQQLAMQGISRKEVDDAMKEITNRLKYGLDPEFNPRPIVGDDTTNTSERIYGNADVMGTDASHGTHVAGLIGAMRGNGPGADGIAPAVRIMTIRTVPDGDERDKDVANAIRYAADNGAHIINMSFGKAFSPHKAIVDAAVKYADSKGVLMMHAAGNDNTNIDSTESFPTPRYLGGGRPDRWIEVGASSWKGGKDLAAEFSNYGREVVDLFAPGVDVMSTLPGNTYDREDGTSMAAPVVSGVAALVMAYYPELSALDVKRVLLNSAVRHPDQKVTRPGDSDQVPFGSLSSTGGIVNAYAAIKMADQMVSQKK